MEAKFIAFSSIVQEEVWLKRFLDHLKVTSSEEPMTIMSDSQSSIAYTKYNTPKITYHTCSIGYFLFVEYEIHIHQLTYNYSY